MVKLINTNGGYLPLDLPREPNGENCQVIPSSPTRTVEGLGVGVLHQRILCSRSRTCRVENLWSSFGHARCGVCVCVVCGVFFVTRYLCWVQNRYMYIYNRKIEDGNNKKTVSEKDNQRMFIEGRSTHCLGIWANFFRSKWHDISTPPKTVGYCLLENGRDENLFGTKDF